MQRSASFYSLSQVDLVRKELAWESEKHSIGLRKLRDRFVVRCVARPRKGIGKNTCELVEGLQAMSSM